MADWAKWAIGSLIAALANVWGNVAAFWLTTWREPINLFTALLVVATFALCIIAWLQMAVLERTDRTAAKAANAALDTVTISREALIEVQRAFVFVKVFQLDIVNDTQRITPMFENSGSTPANPIRWWVNVKKTGPEGLPTNFKYPDLDAQGLELAGKGNGITTYLGPHQTQYAQTMSVPISVMSGVRDGSARVFVWGWVEYSDIFQKALVHRTEFCQEVIAEIIGPHNAEGKAPSAVSMRFYGTYNTAE